MACRARVRSREFKLGSRCPSSSKENILEKFKLLSENALSADMRDLKKQHQTAWKLLLSSFLIGLHIWKSLQSHDFSLRHYISAETLKNLQRPPEYLNGRKGPRRRDYLATIEP